MGKTPTMQELENRLWALRASWAAEDTAKKQREWFLSTLDSSRGAVSPLGGQAKPAPQRGSK
jgi:hypothetical protein